MQQRFDQRLQDWGASGARALLAVSGGADSVCMARLAAASSLDCSFHIAHFDHGLRPESTHDAQFVRELAGSLNMPFHLGKWRHVRAPVQGELNQHQENALAAKSLKALRRASRLEGAKGTHGESNRKSLLKFGAAVQRRSGMEEAARRVRYQFLTAAAERVGARFVLTAHHEDDQVETVVLRLTRGAGAQGLLGILPYRTLSAAVTLARPLLDVPRIELEAQLQLWRQDYCQDASNQDVTIRRNFVRHVLLPQLEAAYDPAIRRRLLVLHQEASQLHACQRERAQAQLEWVESSPSSPMRQGIALPQERVLLDLNKLRHIPKPQVTEVLRVLWQREGWHRDGLTHEHWRELGNCAFTAAGFCKHYPGNVQLRRLEHHVALQPVNPSEAGG